MIPLGQEFIGHLFLTRLFEAIGQKGILKVYRPTGTEELNLQESVVTYDPGKQEVLISYGARTLPILTSSGWLSIQYVPATPVPGKPFGRPAVLLFRKVDNFAMEIVKNVRD